MHSTQKAQLFLLFHGGFKESTGSFKKLTFPAIFTVVVGGSFKIDRLSFSVFLFLFITDRRIYVQFASSIKYL